MSDVWGLTEEDKGGHVLIALTPEECEAAYLACVAQYPLALGSDSAGHLSRAGEEIRRCLRDQKGIEAEYCDADIEETA